MEEEILDATGNPIEIGKWYGRAHVDNGFTEVRIGRVIDNRDGKVKIEVEYSQRALYTGDSKQDVLLVRRIWVKSNTVFPVDEASIKWNKNGQDSHEG